MIPKEEKDKIITTLESKWATKNPCPRCNHQNFTLIDWYFNQSIQSNLKWMTLWWPSVPSVVIVCNNCWFMSQHALWPLNLLPNSNNDDK